MRRSAGQRARELDDTQRPVAGVKRSGAVAQLAGIDFQLRRGVRTRALDQRFAEHAKRAAGAERTARSARAAAGQIGLRRMKTDARRTYTQRCGDDLRKHGFVPLARRMRDREQGHAAALIEFHRDLILRRAAAAARFEISRDANSAQLAGLLALRAP